MLNLYSLDINNILNNYTTNFILKETLYNFNITEFIIMFNIEIFISLSLLFLILFSLIYTQNNVFIIYDLVINICMFITIILLILITNNFILSDYNSLLLNNYISIKLRSLILIFYLLWLNFTKIYIKNNLQYNKGLKTFEYHVLLLLSILGMNFFILSENFISFYISIELLGLPIYILIAFNSNMDTLKSGLYYFIMSSWASSMLLLGSSFLYIFTGTLMFKYMSKVLVWSYYLNLYYNYYIFTYLSFIILVFGLALKLGAVPFHTWVVSVYDGASTHLTLFMATILKIPLLYGLFKICMLFFFIGNFNIIILNFNIQELLSYFSLWLGGFGAYRQLTFKRLLGYSSIHHTGFFLLSMLGVTHFYSIFSLLLHIIMYFSVTFSFFFIIVYNWNSVNKEHVAYLDSFINSLIRYKYISLILAIIVLTFSGVPPFNIFFSKYSLLVNSINNYNYNISILAILATTFSSFIYLRICKLLLFTTDGRNISIPLYFYNNILSINYFLSLLFYFSIFYILFPNKIYNMLYVISIV